MTSAFEFAAADPLLQVTWQDIVSHKQRSPVELRQDLLALLAVRTDRNPAAAAGNRFLYHYQFENLLRCRRLRSGRPRASLAEIWADPDLRAHLLDQTRLRARGGSSLANNIFECYRINTGSIVMFKAAAARYVYARYGAHRVLDPCAGWGGRMLGAWSLGLDYVGIDTNRDMAAAYDGMIAFLQDFAEIDNPLFETDRTSHLRMIWDSCRAVDFGQIDYDFVLTSPPYINMEIYEHMPLWPSDEAFYREFYIPLYHQLRANIKKGGTICLNVSPGMHAAALEYGLPPPDGEEDLLQQAGQARGRKPQDKIYIWRC